MKNKFDYRELLECARGELFGKNNPQLPLPNMLMVHRISDINSVGGKKSKGEIIAEMDINPGQWFFHCHFAGDPVMPGCLGLDAMWQLLGFYLGWRGYQGRGRALGCGEVKFLGQVLPSSKKVVYHIHIKRVISRDLVLGQADGHMIVDGKEIYIAKDLRVGLFKPEKTAPQQ